MENKKEKILVKAKDFKPGVIYGGTPVGEFQLDIQDNKTIWWKNTLGEIKKVNPHPNSIFYVKEII